MEILLSESQLKFLITESVYVDDACKTFKDQSTNQFCRSIYEILTKTINQPGFKKETRNLAGRLQRAQNLVSKEKDDEYKVIYKNIKQFQEIYQRKVFQLKLFINELSPSCSILKSRANEILRDLQKNGSYMLLYKKETEDGETYNYSVLNRLQTNQSGLAVLMTEYGIHKNPNLSPQEIVDLFLRDNLVAVDELVPYLRDVLIKPNHIRRKVIDSIEFVKRKGDDTEDEYLRFLTKKGDNFIPFGDDFGMVDMKLGVDLLQSENGEYFPVQVKSSKTSANRSYLKIWDYVEPGCKCSTVYPLQENKGWGEVVNKKSKGKSGVVSDLTINKLKTGSAQIRCNEFRTFVGSNGKTYNYCEGTTVPAEGISPRKRYVQFLVGNKDEVIAQVDTTKKVLNTGRKRFEKKGITYYSIYYQIDV